MIVLRDYPGERFQELWDHLRAQDYAFDDIVRHDPMLFINQFAIPGNLFFEVGDMKGLITASNVVPLLSTNLHLSMWDKVSAHELISAIKSLEAYLFYEYSLHRISAFIPDQNLQARRLAHVLGYKTEGIIRQSFLVNKKYSDVHLFGLLRSEFDRQ